MALLTKDTTLLLLRYPRSRSCSKSVSLTSTGFVTHPVPSLPSHFRFPLVLLDRKHSLHSTARADRNLLAKYEFDPSRSRIPGPSLDLLRGSNRPNLNPNSGSNDVFMTSATTPVSASIQEPVADTALQQQVENGGRKMTPLPAMIPISDEKEIRKTKAKDEEANKGKVARNKPITVQGVTVQVKPKPPGEEECCMSGCVVSILSSFSLCRSCLYFRAQRPSLAKSSNSCPPPPPRSGNRTVYTPCTPMMSLLTMSPSAKQGKLSSAPIFRGYRGLPRSVALIGKCPPTQGKSRKMSNNEQMRM